MVSRKRKLKVYGVSIHVNGIGQRRVIAAVHSKREFADLNNCSLHFINVYAGETGNEDEIALATSQPHVRFYSPDIRYRVSEYRKVRP